MTLNREEFVGVLQAAARRGHVLQETRGLGAMAARAVPCLREVVWDSV